MLPQVKPLGQAAVEKEVVARQPGPLAKSFVRPPGQSWTGNFEEVLAMHGTAMHFLPLTRLIQI